MNPLDRIRLIKEIAISLQDQFTTIEINLFLGGYGIQGLTMQTVESKRVYSTQILQSESNETIYQIAKDLKLEVPKTFQPLNKNETSTSHEKKVFISHSSKDAKIVEQVIELLEAIGLQENQIFCTSFEGYNIKIGTDWLQTLKDELNKEILVIFILSDNFYESPISLCEMGATWVKTNEHIPILIPPFNYSKIQGVIPNTQGMKINEKNKLNSLKELVELFFSLKPKSYSVWERKRDNALTKIEGIVSTNFKNEGTKSTNGKFNLISEEGVGPFLMHGNMHFPSGSANFKVRSEKLSRMTDEGPAEEDYYVISQGGKELLNVRTTPDASQFEETIEEIIVISEIFRTKERIGVNSTIGEFISAYPNHRAWFTYISDMYVLEARDLHLQFLLPENCYQEKFEFSSEITELDIFKFDQKAKIMKVRLWS